MFVGLWISKKMVRYCQRRRNLGRANPDLALRTVNIGSRKRETAGTGSSAVAGPSSPTVRVSGRVDEYPFGPDSEKSSIAGGPVLRTRLQTARRLSSGWDDEPNRQDVTGIVIGLKATANTTSERTLRSAKASNDSFKRLY